MANAPVKSANRTSLMTLREVAEYYRRPPETLRWWRHVGRGPKSFKIGRQIVYDREEVEAFLEAQRREGSEPDEHRRGTPRGRKK